LFSPGKITAMHRSQTNTDLYDVDIGGATKTVEASRVHKAITIKRNKKDSDSPTRGRSETLHSEHWDPHNSTVVAPAITTRSTWEDRFSETFADPKAPAGSLSARSAGDFHEIYKVGPELSAVTGGGIHEVDGVLFDVTDGEQARSTSKKMKRSITRSGSTPLEQADEERHHLGHLATHKTVFMSERSNSRLFEPYEGPRFNSSVSGWSKASGRLEEEELEEEDPRSCHSADIQVNLSEVWGQLQPGQPRRRAQEAQAKAFSEWGGKHRTAVNWKP
jgi:hypothetical protein